MRLFLLSLAAGLLLAAVGAAYSEFTALHRAVSTGQQALARVSTQVSGGALERAVAGPLDLAEPCANLSVAAAAFGEAMAGMERLVPLLQVVEQVPLAAQRTEAQVALVASASEVSAAGAALCEGLGPVAALLQRPAPGEPQLAEALLASLAASRPSLDQARARLARAEGLLAELPLAALEPEVRQAVQALTAKLPALRAAVEALLVLPDLLGTDGPRTYLLLAQNREELRPTGGYIGTAGIVRVANGQLTYAEFGTSVVYDLPPDRLVPPPAPLARYLRSSYWHLRDANWWPDFPSSAEQMAYFYNQVRGEPLDGVIAFDQRTLELLLEVTGPIEVPEYGETLTAANLQERLDYYVHADPGRADEWERKAFVGMAAAAVLRSLASAPPEQLPAYARAVGRALAGKHLLVYLGTPAGMQLAAELNWDGHLYQGPGDYVFAVSANVSPNKVDRYIERAARYTVDLTQTPPQARLTLELANRFDPAATAPWPTTRYRDYLRVYVPWQSALQAAVGFADAVETSTECGRTVFAGLVEVPPGERTTVVLEYAPNPAVMAAGPYLLAVQKQPGVDPIPLTVEVVGPAGTVTVQEQLEDDRTYRLEGGALHKGVLPPPAAAGVACATPKPAPTVLPPPARLAIPRLRVDAPVTFLQVRPTGEMEVPADGQTIGWYEASARPGYAGNFVATAHVDWGGRPAVFWRLYELQPGDQIVVTDTAGEKHTYVVEWNRAVRPEDAPLADLVGPSHDKLLTLITCTGNFNPLTRDYSHRQIVRARLAEGA